MMSVSEFLTRAKRAIESGDTSMRAAAEDIAAAQKQGATQRQIAEAVGKSVGWVNRLLQWRSGGYQAETAFGPQSKARRQRAKCAQAPEQDVDPHIRDLLVKCLGMLGSEHHGERASAALKVEEQRARLGRSWQDLIVPANGHEHRRRRVAWVALRPAPGR